LVPTRATGDLDAMDLASLNASSIKEVSMFAKSHIYTFYE
jgi:hypothetical protein